MLHRDCKRFISAARRPKHYGRAERSPPLAARLEAPFATGITSKTPSASRLSILHISTRKSSFFFWRCCARPRTTAGREARAALAD